MDCVTVPASVWNWKARSFTKATRHRSRGRDWNNASACCSGYEMDAGFRGPANVRIWPTSVRALSYCNGTVDLIWRGPIDSRSQAPRDRNFSIVDHKCGKNGVVCQSSCWQSNPDAVADSNACQIWPDSKILRLAFDSHLCQILG